MKVLTGGVLIDGTGRDPIPNASVVIGDDGRITEAGALARLPLDAEVYDVGGRTIMPGLMDAHVHFMLAGERDFESVFLKQTSEYMAIKATVSARNLLDAGFTTVRDVGAPGRLALSLRDAVNAGLVPGPRILAAGRIITATSGHVDLLPPGVSRVDGTAGRIADGPAEILRAVREQVKVGADLIKFCATGGVMDPQLAPDVPEYSAEEVQTLITEAHKMKKPVAAHVHGAEGAKIAIRAGVDTIEHGTMLDEEAVQLMREAGTVLVPTLTPSHQVRQQGDAANLPAHVMEKFAVTSAAHAQSLTMAIEAGVSLALGTDAGTPFYPHGLNAIELQLMVAEGLSPMATIVAATSGAAKALRVDKSTGSLVPGKLADLLVVDGDPLADIALLQDQSRLHLILQSGQVHKDLVGAA